MTQRPATGWRFFWMATLLGSSRVVTPFPVNDLSAIASTRANSMRTEMPQRVLSTPTAGNKLLSANSLRASNFL